MHIYLVTTPTKQIAATSLAAIYDHMTPAEVGVSLSRLYHLKLPYTSYGCSVTKLEVFRKKQRNSVVPVLHDD